jgi:DNA-directed RNA polymerase
MLINEKILAKFSEQMRYYYDFRGRRYPATAYFHEQGTDLAKGLLLREDKKEIGKEGFFWLMVSIASNWAGASGREDGAKTDKIPLKDRYLWSTDNEDILLDYAMQPKVNQGWMKADKPWQFLAACNELKKLREWQIKHGFHLDPFNDFGYSSSLECFVDGSNNGSQHLSALTKDEITAPHVNLVPLELPGDLYKYVADYVWDKLEIEKSKFTKKEIGEAETVIDTLIQLKKDIYNAEFKSEQRKELLERIREFRDKNIDIIPKIAPIYWCRVKDVKQRRKVVKRNVMTLPLI